ncbi:MAG: SDR family NAD(P)-dependent oxidoreductase, partial [Chromatiales bacterium]|nr:SDR family NAD(P)-dependent oxidoreductase [Chromatiales bacterium]
ADLRVLLRSVATLWVEGSDVDWDQLHHGERRRRVPLPTYPFERSKFWLQPEAREPVAMALDTTMKQSDIGDWFYTPTWAASAVPFSALKGDGRPWLILGDGAFADVVEQRLLDAGEMVTRISFGRAFDPGRAEDMASLFEQWRDGSAAPGYVVHAGNVLYGAGLVKPSEVQDRAFFSNLFLVQELGKLALTRPVRVGVVTDRLFGLAGEASVAPERATLLGPCRVTPREHADIQTAAIDLPEITSATETALAEVVITEMVAQSSDSVVAYRDDQRWVQTLERTRLEAVDRTGLPLKPGGCYLITGGTGGIGLTVAEHLARQYQAKLVLTSRGGPPADGDPRADRIRDIEGYGAEVLVAKADVSNLDGMRQVVEEAERRFGRIDGVFHSAGVPGGGIIQRKEALVAASVLEPKVKGTQVLETLFKDRGPDLVVLFSSAASVAGPFGQVDYCGANAFLDAFAESRHGRSATLWVSIDWDDWAEVGMAVETSTRLGSQADTPAPDKVENLTHPLFVRREHNGECVSLVASVGADSGWLLAEHVLFGNPTVPGSAFLEYARAAFECVTGHEGCEMNDLFVLMPMSVPTGGEREMSVILTPAQSGYSFVIESGTGADRQEHVRGSIGPIGSSEVRHDLYEIRAACNVQVIGEEVLAQYRAAKEGGYLALGPRWNNTERVSYGDGVVLGEHALAPEFRDDVATFKLHPAFTDFTALYPLYLSQSEKQYVPFSYDAVRVRGPLPAEVLTWTHVKDSIEHTPRAIRFDCHFLDRSGRELLEIDNLVLHLMQERSASEGTDPNTPNFALGIQTPGVLESFAVEPSPRRAPQAGEVEIQVAAAGLNFRDVLRALG